MTGQLTDCTFSVTMKTDDVLRSVEDAHAIQSEFAEWLDPNNEDHEIYSLEYLGDDD